MQNAVEKCNESIEMAEKCYLIGLYILIYVFNSSNSAIRFISCSFSFFKIIRSRIERMRLIVLIIIPPKMHDFSGHSLLTNY